MDNGNLWLGRFMRTEVISSTSAFRVVACVDVLSEQRRTVVAAEPRADQLTAAIALDRLFEAHREPLHPVIARAIERGHHETTGFVVFDFPARLDFDQVLRLGLEGGWKAPYSEADGFSTTLRDALLASPTPLGVFSHGNVLFAADGSHVLLGFGHNVAVHDERGRIVVRARFYQAPEVAVGGTPTMSSDLVGMVEMTRATMAFVKVHEAIGRIIMGNTLGEDMELMRLILWYESKVMRGAPAMRPSIEEYMAVSTRIRALLGSVPDAQGFRNFVRGMLLAERPELVEGGRILKVARDSSSFEVMGEITGEAVVGPVRERVAKVPVENGGKVGGSASRRADLRKHRLLSRLLGALVSQRIHAPGAPLSVDVLIQAGWPGEKMQRDAGLNRVYVAIAALRRAGLNEDLERSDGGYRLRPSTVVRLED